MSSLLSEIFSEAEAPPVSVIPAPSTAARISPAQIQNNIVAIALQEWNRWQQGTLKESALSMRGILTGYWNSTPGGSTILSKPNWWNIYAWSAAFICYVLKTARAGSAFRYSSYHTTYTFHAKQNRIRGIANTFKAYRVSERKPQLGDIIIQNYDSSGRNYDTVKANEGGAHGDIVVEVSSDHVKVIGGNVAQSVTRRAYPINASGFLSSGRHWAIVAIENGTSVSPSLSSTVTVGASGATAGMSTGTCPTPIKIPSDLSKTIKQRKKGYAGYGGGRLSPVLAALNSCGKLTITADEVDMFQRISNVETGGLVQAINSWDSAYMSMGFMQLTAKYGELQKLIHQAPAAFHRYGIAVDTQKYPSGQNRIVGTSNPNELRSRAWAERFFRAGLDQDVIAAQVIRGRAIIQSVLVAVRKWLGQNFLFFNSFYTSSPLLRALVQETHNNRPAYLKSALIQTVSEARSKNITQLAPFLTMLRDKIKSVYAANAAREKDTPQHMQAKAENIISKTSNL